MTHVTIGVKRREAIKLLHDELKSGRTTEGTSIPLSAYQNASSKGQDITHGGDSSKILVQWLQTADPPKLRVLEVGCLEADNMISKYVNYHDGSIRRIDLKSRDPRIEEEDFMTLVVPEQVFPPVLELRAEIRFNLAIVGT